MHNTQNVATRWRKDRGHALPTARLSNRLFSSTMRRWFSESSNRTRMSVSSFQVSVLIRSSTAVELPICGGRMLGEWNTRVWWLSFSPAPCPQTHTHTNAAAKKSATGNLDTFPPTAVPPGPSSMRQNRMGHLSLAICLCMAKEWSDWNCRWKSGRKSCSNALNWYRSSLRVQAACVHKRLEALSMMFRHEEAVTSRHASGRARHSACVPPLNRPAAAAPALGTMTCRNATTKPHHDAHESEGRSERRMLLVRPAVYQEKLPPPLHPARLLAVRKPAFCRLS